MERGIAHSDNSTLVSVAWPSRHWPLLNKQQFPRFKHSGGSGSYLSSEREPMIFQNVSTGPLSYRLLALPVTYI